MELANPSADIFVPDGIAVADALARTTHLAVGAHQDDIEFIALHGILECFDRADRWFTGVTVTDGAGSPRAGAFAECTDAEMRRVRSIEQREAAAIGHYGCQIQLMYPSAELKDGSNRQVVANLRAIFEHSRPQVVYLHNPADTHDTHVACCLRSIAALRELAGGDLPRSVWGCEVWRDLDWLVGDDKQVLAINDSSGLGLKLAAAFRSQVAGGKRYDLAARGRRLANATFHESHSVDSVPEISFAMDLTPLVVDQSLDVAGFTARLLQRTIDDVADRIAKMAKEN